MLKLDDPQSLPLLYHLNSQPWLNTAAYSAPPPDRCSEPVSAGMQPLPGGNEPSVLEALILGRRSCRNFDAARTLAPEAVGRLLRLAYGACEAGGLPRRLVRPPPSAGGLYPLRLLVSLQRVTGFADGLYQYWPQSHALQRRGDLAPAALGALLIEQRFVQDANLVLFLVADLGLTIGKYGARGYRYVLIEAGHVGQILCLAAGEAQLASVCIGGFFDTRLRAALGLKGALVWPLYAVVAGWAP